MTATASHTPSGRRPARQRGFTYVSLIILVAVIGLVTAASVKLGVMLQRTAAEKELLNIGAQFSDALQSYASATPPGQPAQPPTLQELLKDPRFPGIRRHLRKIFVDPVTGKAEWGVVYMAGASGVLAVYSLSDAKAIKIANFPARYQGFEGKLHLADWKFARTGDQVPAPGQPGRPGQPAPGIAPPVAPPAAPMLPAPQPAEPAPDPEPEEAPPAAVAEPPPTERQAPPSAGLPTWPGA